MTVSNLFPALRDLSRVDKLRVMQFLVAELAREEELALQQGATYSVWSPLNSHEAAHKLAQLLELGQPTHNAQAQRFDFTEGFDTFGVPDALPQVPLFLTYRGLSLEILALLDTGASVNVLPFKAVEMGTDKQESFEEMKAYLLADDQFTPSLEVK